MNLMDQHFIHDRINLPHKTITEIERGFQKAVDTAVNCARTYGHQIALYDRTNKCSYLEYPNGIREHIDK